MLRNKIKGKNQSKNKITNSNKRNENQIGYN